MVPKKYSQEKRKQQEVKAANRQTFTPLTEEKAAYSRGCNDGLNQLGCRENGYDYRQGYDRGVGLQKLAEPVTVYNRSLSKPAQPATSYTHSGYETILY